MNRSEIMNNLMNRSERFKRIEGLPVLPTPLLSQNHKPKYNPHNNTSKIKLGPSRSDFNRGHKGAGEGRRHFLNREVNGKCLFF